MTSDEDGRKIADEKGKPRPLVCEWRNQADALNEFASFDGMVESARHIKPLHWYIACRLVVEGGFHPDDVTPRPPFTVTKNGKDFILKYDPSYATGSERTVLGGLKTKSVDVVVTKNGIGPVIAVSCKGMTGALRNLTNRMEETVGESANLHITYPSLVFGYVFVLRANKAEAAEAMGTSTDVEKNRRTVLANDVAIGDDNSPVASLERFHYALSEMTGRRGIRNDLSRYEAVCLGVVSKDGSLLDYPPLDSSIRVEKFFEALYTRYTERFVLNAPSLASTTRRRLWSQRSPVLVPGGLPSKPEYRYHVEYDN